MFDKILEYITQNKVNFIIDVVLSLFLIFFLIVSFIKTKKPFVNSLRVIVFIIAGLICVMLEAKIMTYLVLFLTFALVLNNFFFVSSDEKRTHKRNTNNENAKEVVETRAQLVDTLVDAVGFLASRKIGAIITFERNDSLNSYVEKSIKIDAYVTDELIKTIFFPNTALHDGAVIIQKGKIACAGAYYPLSDKSDIPSSLGTRHRAAIGISEDCDALSIVVSEETGAISYTLDGTITQAISVETLKNILEQNVIMD